MAKKRRVRAVVLLGEDAGDEYFFDSIQEASDATGVSPATITKSMDNPRHITNVAARRTPMTVKGTGRKHIPLFSFEDVTPRVVRLIPLSNDEDREYEFTAHSYAINFLGISRSTYYQRKDTSVPVQDRNGEYWQIVFLEKDEERGEEE